MKPSLEAALDQLRLLLKEIAFTGDLLYQGLVAPLLALQAGRAPRTLELEAKLAEYRSLLGALQEIETEAMPLLSQLQQGRAQWKSEAKIDGKNFGELLEATQEEFAHWKQYSQRVGVLLKRLTLIAHEEKITALGKAPILDAWEEVKNAI
jgi:hypothetical protein